MYCSSDSFRVETERIVDRYQAIRVWHKLLTSADSEYWVQLSAGTVVGTHVAAPFHSPRSTLTHGLRAVVDNHRVLHGRSSFTGKRRMCGAYIGVDEYRSKLAVLSEQFEPDAIVRATNDIPEVNVNGRNIWNSAL